jgi:AcrR family transcriptional regulator
VPPTDLIEARPGAQLRNEPVQARSTARLTALLDAAAVTVHELGYERLTTAMVAQRAGASIGTVYRYFPDRIAVLQALAARNLDRILDAARDAIADTRHTTWEDAVGAAFDAYVELFQSEPGFASLRGGDVIDLRPAASSTTHNSLLAAAMLTALSSRFGLKDVPANRVVAETAVEVMDALTARAFARGARGDQAFLGSGRALLLSILADRLD